jgi:hypothetical protein
MMYLDAFLFCVCVKGQNSVLLLYPSENQLYLKSQFSGVAPRLSYGQGMVAAVPP